MNELCAIYVMPVIVCWCVLFGLTFDGEVKTKKGFILVWFCVLTWPIAVPVIFMIKFMELWRKMK